MSADQPNDAAAAAAVTASESLRLTDAVANGTENTPEAVRGSGRGGGLERVLIKLKASVASGNYYEAHQMYRTLYYRYLLQSRYVDCLHLLHEGAVQFLDHEQRSIGADLGCLVVDTLSRRGNTEVAKETDVEFWLNRLGDLMQKIGPAVVEREALLVGVPSVEMS